MENIITEKDLIVAEVFEKTKMLKEAYSVPTDQGKINGTSIRNSQQDISNADYYNKCSYTVWLL